MKTVLNADKAQNPRLHYDLKTVQFDTGPLLKMGFNKKGSSPICYIK